MAGWLYYLPFHNRTSQSPSSAAIETIALTDLEEEKISSGGGEDPVHKDALTFEATSSTPTMHTNRAERKNQVLQFQIIPLYFQINLKEGKYCISQSMMAQSFNRASHVLEFSSIFSEELD
jgi:hypothetical protein